VKAQVVVEFANHAASRQILVGTAWIIRLLNARQSKDKAAQTGAFLSFAAEKAAYDGSIMKSLLLPALLLAAPLALAQQATPARQRPAALRSVVEQFLATETAGLPGKVTVKVGVIDPRMSLPACPAPEAFLQPGARAWGKTTVGVRCAQPTPWTVYIQAQVSVLADYVAAAVPLAQGQPVETGQLMLMKGDIAAMPNGIVTDMAQAVGRTPTVSLAAGTPLRLDTLKSRPVVQQGQSVRLVSSGAGFSVSAEGRAIGTAGDGQVVQVRTPSGAVISGTARPGGVVEVAF
jgi:flagella basal body P-ring formation protein FlgA